MQSSSQVKIKFKLTFIGDQSVGKTSIISRFVMDNFQPTNNPTIGIDFLSKTIIIQSQPIRLQLWDTAGQQRFRSLIPSYIRDANCCFIVFDLSCRSSYNSLNQWIDFLKDTKLYTDTLVYIIGNKVDLNEENKEVKKQEIEEFLKMYGNQFQYIEVSAKTGKNIQEMFNQVAEKLYNEKSKKNKKDIDDKNKQNKDNNINNNNNNNIVINKEKYVQSEENTQRKCYC